jgi:hypothetical protein
VSPPLKEMALLTYRGKHERVERLRGKAHEHPCCRCWENDVVVIAAHWARIRTENGNDPWSDHVPLCEPCHRHYDRHDNDGVNAKLCPDDVVLIRFMLAEGDSVTNVAFYFDVSITTICRIRDRKRWSWIE